MYIVYTYLHSMQIIEINEKLVAKSTKSWLRNQRKVGCEINEKLVARELHEHHHMRRLEGCVEFEVVYITYTSCQKSVLLCFPI